MHRRRGSTYVMVLGVSMTITVVGLAGISARRLRTRSTTRTNGFARARMLAFSGAEHALVRINADGDWRTTYDGATVQQTSGGGTFSWQVTDPADGNLTDDSSEAATITATGTYGGTSYTLTLGVTAATSPMAALSYAVTVDGKVEVKDGKEVNITGAALASNHEVKVKSGAVLYADVEAASVELDGKTPGVIVGTVTTPGPTHSMPDSGVFDTYKNLATEIVIGGKDPKIEKVLLSPTSNPWGATNSDGLYYIDVGDNDLKINKCRILGTLVVDVGGKGKVKIGGGKNGAVLMQNYRSGYPVLIVNGKVDVDVDSATKDLTESDAKTNLNPAGSPYDSETDDDESDSYPNEIRGLLHVLGELKLKKTARIRGVIICEDNLKFEGDVHVIYDSAASNDPPSGYGSGSGGVAAGAWNRSVTPPP